MSTASDSLSSTGRRSGSPRQTGSISPSSPRTGASSAPVLSDQVRLAYRPSPQGRGHPFLSSPIVSHHTLLVPQSSSTSSPVTSTNTPPASPSSSRRRVRTSSVGQQTMDRHLPPSPSSRRILHDAMAKARARDAQRMNDSMVYLDGPQIYTCAQCRTHLTSHDDIISKSFHGRHGRAYLFDQCVNVTMGPVEERRLITGLHAVCDIFCKRCNTLVGWTYQKAYDASQKYKEGKFIIEKINLHLEESDYYDVAPPAGERADRWRRRSMSWGSDSDRNSVTASPGDSMMVFEYHPSSTSTTPNASGPGTT